MVKVGYFLASEEFGPNELVEQAKMAEKAGFKALWISDHFHPWTSKQGNSPFVWSVIGGSPRRLPRDDRRNLPNAADSSGHRSPGRGDLGRDAGGRFSLGVRSGENLNE